MIKRPETLSFTWGALAKDPVTGFMTASPEGSFTGSCGVFPNQSSRTISVGGVALDYTFLITLDLGTEIPKGAEVTIHGKQMQVIHYYAWQKHAEIWV